MTVGPDSKIIPEAVVEDAWREIGGLSDEQALGHMNRVSRTQPALLTFVMTFSEDLSSSAAELATYMFLVVVHMFDVQFGKRLQNVGPKRIEAIHEHSLATAERLKNADERLLEQAANLENEKQPWVWRYVTQCLLEPDPDLELSEEDQGSLTLIMKTVIDSLHSSVRD